MPSQVLVALVLGGATFTMSIPIGMKLAGREPAFIAGLGFSAGPRGSLWAWFAAVLLAFGYVFFCIQRIPEVAGHWHTLSWLKALSVIAAIAAGIVEEGIFRRLIMDGVARIGGSTLIQIAVSAVAFGIAHGTWGFLGGSLHAAISAAGATTVLGAGLAMVYVMGGRSLAPCIVAHFLIDSVIEPGLLLSAASGFHA